MSNPGVFPYDPTTTVGSFRTVYGDIASVPLSPTVVGYQDYTYFSDDEIIVFIDQGQQNVLRGVGFAILQAANAASLQSKMVKDYDLQVDLTKRAADLRSTANQYFDIANQYDERAGLFDYFDFIETGSIPNFYPTGLLWPFLIPFGG